MSSLVSVSFETSRIRLRLKKNYIQQRENLLIRVSDDATVTQILCAFFFSGNISFSCVAHRLFFRGVRPFYILPSKYLPSSPRSFSSRVLLWSQFTLDISAGKFVRLFFFITFCLLHIVAPIFQNNVL